MLPNGQSRLDEEYLEGLTQLLKEDHPDKNIAKQDVLAVANYLMSSITLIYRPIPRAKEAEYKEILRTVEKIQRRRIDATN